MRKIVFLFFASFVFICVAFSQTVIENPEKPLSKNAGRVLKHKEVLRIADESVRELSQFLGDSRWKFYFPLISTFRFF